MQPNITLHDRLNRSMFSKKTFKISNISLHKIKLKFMIKYFTDKGPTMKCGKYLLKLRLETCREDLADTPPDTLPDTIPILTPLIVLGLISRESKAYDDEGLSLIDGKPNSLP